MPNGVRAQRPGRVFASPPVGAGAGQAAAPYAVTTVGFVRRVAFARYRLLRRGAFAPCRLLRRSGICAVRHLRPSGFALSAVVS